MAGCWLLDQLKEREKRRRKKKKTPPSVFGGRTAVLCSLAKPFVVEKELKRMVKRETVSGTEEEEEKSKSEVKRNKD